MTLTNASTRAPQSRWTAQTPQTNQAGNGRPLPSVFVIDDDPSVRRALSRLIKSAGYQLHAFSSAREFLASECRCESPACLVLDVCLPGLSGLDLQGELIRAHANLPIIFITGHGNIPMSVRAMKCGAVDFLPKLYEQGLARAADEDAEREERDSIQRRLDNLTPREKEVMALVVKGLLNKQIAFELGTAEKTIKVHRARVMEKMDVDSLAELVHVAAHAGIGEN